jgi:hypothetical protein
MIRWVYNIIIICQYPRPDYIPTYSDKLFYAFDVLNTYIFGPLAWAYIIVTLMNRYGWGMIFLSIPIIGVFIYQTLREYSIVG